MNGRVVVAAALLLAGCDPVGSDGAPPIRLADVLRTPDAAGFAHALAPRPMTFPADDGPHDDFRTEWWYWTGNVTTDEGRPFGFQLTFFRSAVAAAMPARHSKWATRQVWMAHLAVTDVEDGELIAHERFARGALGLAGAQAEPFRVWVESWSAVSRGPGYAPLRLQAEEDGTGIDLVIEPGEPPVLQGDRGLSQKGPEAGNASFYFSRMRSPVHGAVDVRGQRFAVRGSAWLDREWSTSALGDEQVGWDWLSLQLDDDSELMLYRLRRADGSVDRWSSGTFVAADGTVSTLGVDDFTMRATGSWSAPDGKARYPAGFEVAVPRLGLTLVVTPRVADAELRLSVRYQEAAVTARGTAGGRPVTGSGYLEMTGYVR